MNDNFDARSRGGVNRRQRTFSSRNRNRRKSRNPRNATPLQKISDKAYRFIAAEDTLSRLSAPSDKVHQRPSSDGPLAQAKRDQQENKRRKMQHNGSHGFTEPKIKHSAKSSRRVLNKHDKPFFDLVNEDGCHGGSATSSGSFSSDASHPSPPDTTNAVCGSSGRGKRKSRVESTKDYDSSLGDDDDDESSSLTRSREDGDATSSAPKRDDRRSGNETKKAVDDCFNEVYTPDDRGSNRQKGKLSGQSNREAPPAANGRTSNPAATSKSFRVTKRNNPKPLTAASIGTRASLSGRPKSGRSKIIPGASLGNRQSPDKPQSKIRRRSISSLAAERQKTEPETIAIDSSDDENDETDSEIQKFDLVRISLGSEHVVHNSCHLELYPDTRRLVFSFLHQKKRTRSGRSGQLREFNIEIGQDATEMKHFTSSEDCDSTEENVLPSFMTFLAQGKLVREIRRACPGFQSMVALEFRESSDLKLFCQYLEQPLKHGASRFLNEMPEAEAKNVHTAAFACDEVEEEERRKSLEKAKSSTFLRDKDEDDVLVVFPFGGDRRDMIQAAEGLNELSLATENDDSLAHGMKPSGRGHYLTLRVQDYLRLEPTEYLNDTLIDFWMLWISQGDSIMTHFFSTHFFSTLAKKGPEGVKNWTMKRSIDIFKKQLIFIPINKSLHWSLAVVVNPRLVETSGCCILFFDSLRAHSMQLVASKIREWLNGEWARGNGDSEQPFTGESTKVYAPKVPYQDNGWDCGVFVCRYAYALYQMRRTVLPSDDENSFCAHTLAKIVPSHELFHFGAEEIEKIRKNFKTFLENLSRVYQTWKKKCKLARSEKRSKHESITECPSEAADPGIEILFGESRQNSVDRSGHIDKSNENAESDTIVLETVTLSEPKQVIDAKSDQSVADRSKAASSRDPGSSAKLKHSPAEIIDGADVLKECDPIQRDATESMHNAEKQGRVVYLSVDSEGNNSVCGEQDESREGLIQDHVEHRAQETASGDGIEEEQESRSSTIKSLIGGGPNEDNMKDTEYQLTSVGSGTNFQLCSAEERVTTPKAARHPREVNNWSSVEFEVDVPEGLSISHKGESSNELTKCSETAEQDVLATPSPNTKNIGGQYDSPTAPGRTLSTPHRNASPERWHVHGIEEENRKDFDNRLSKQRDPSSASTREGRQEHGECASNISCSSKSNKSARSPCGATPQPNFVDLCHSEDESQGEPAAATPSRKPEQTTPSKAAANAEGTETSEGESRCDV
eukprot:CAMPEP_0168734242 /NCGR_PEP_ID=MMETSP0724-20121128/8709_1 /TAXON_ID=265536 /ORGANISM="Amphiprora sp., Strain CCMP467" /LENGTH=1244 /DNA_ID=CAMNT_0008781333 /DNA_START=148 /DNA_END=3882 /DNA_ORIENTATION=+